MSVREEPVWFPCESDALLGILAFPEVADAAPMVGVVIVVGGPQYRAGSHRQFALLARRLAGEGVPTLRFDYRGMGDSTGRPHAFTDINADIAAAIRTLLERANVREVVLWGLCDAASAILLAVGEQRNVAGVAIINPWVSSDGSAESIRLKHYYGARVLSSSFWRKIAQGDIAWRASVKAFIHSAAAAVRHATRLRLTENHQGAGYQARMARGLGGFRGPALLILSGNDYTAREFLDHVARDEEWRALIEGERVWRKDLPDADHTFSAPDCHKWLEEQTVSWLKSAVLGTRSPKSAASTKRPWQDLQPGTR